MRRKWIWLLVGWLMVVGIVGCAQAVSLDTPASEAVAATATALIPPTQVIQEETVAISPTIPIPSDPALQGLVMQAKEDLARRLSIEVEQIGLVEAKAVEWPDASLGCPQPGMMYAQVQQDGLLIRLAVGTQVYAYHSGGNRAPFLCEQTLQVPQATPKLDELLPLPSLPDG